jgi:hypothetical protein
MSTILQQNLAKEIIKDAKSSKRRNKKELVASSGYGEVTANKHATEVIEQKGVKEALSELGFDVESAKRVVKEIMSDGRTKPDTRLKATDQVFKVFGSYEDTKNGANKTLIINVPKEVAEAFNLETNDTKEG